MLEPAPVRIMTFATPQGESLDRNWTVGEDIQKGDKASKSRLEALSWLKRCAGGGSTASRSQSMTKPISSGALPEKPEAIGQKGTESIRDVW